MAKQFPVLYTEQKKKKVKLWLDGYLVPRATLNSAMLISAGKHEIDVVFYSHIDEIQPGKEFETDRYLITVEESHQVNEPLPRPSFAINDPTMKNRPKSAVFVPPRLVPRTEPPPPPPPATTMAALERHNPNQWGYAGMTTAMKRTVQYDDHEENDYSSYPSKHSKPSTFIPPTFQTRVPVEPPKPPPSSVRSQQPGLLNDSLMQQLMGKPASTTVRAPEAKPSNTISWSNWDEEKSDDDQETDSLPSSSTLTREPPPSVLSTNLPTKSMQNWHSLIQSAVPLCPIDNQKTTSEAMPNFDFDEQSIDALFDNLED